MIESSSDESNDNDNSENNENDDDDENNENNDDDDSSSSSSSSSSSYSSSPSSSASSSVADGDSSKRLAIQKCDWTHVRAGDLFLVLRSFLPTHGRLDKVSIIYLKNNNLPSRHYIETNISPLFFSRYLSVCLLFFRSLLFPVILGWKE